MPDTIDNIQELQALEEDGLLVRAHRAAVEIPAGTPGMCRSCDEFSPRLVGETCAPCRDEELILAQRRR